VRHRVTTGAGVTALVVLVFALNFYRLPVVALTPGPAEDVLARIKVQGSTPVYDSKGKLYLTSVGIDDDVRFYEALLDLANRDVELRPRSELFPDGDSNDEIDRENVQLMDQSKTVAQVVALRELGYPVKPSGVVVGDVVRGTPADGRLETGSSRSTGAPWPASTRCARPSPAIAAASASPSWSRATPPAPRWRSGWPPPTGSLGSGWS
jgi:PDZ domain-containing secreted protein